MLVNMDKNRFNRKNFKKLNRELYILPELLPDREIKKYVNVWVDKYNFNVPTNAIMKSDFKFNEFLNMDINIGKKKKRK